MPVTYSSKSRKRRINKDLWKQVKAKKAQAKGKEYKSRNGNIVAKKKVCETELCSQKCSLKCSQKLTLVMRKELYSNYYSLDQNGKHKYMFYCMESFKPIQTKNVHQASFRYFVTIQQQKIQLCRTALLKLFSQGNLFI